MCKRLLGRKLLFLKWRKNDRIKTHSLELLDSLLAGYQTPEDLIGENGLLKQLTRALVERALVAEMPEHLGHGKH